MALSKGTLVDHYRIVRKLGSGGMGDVYLADDTKLKRKAALKFLPVQLGADRDLVARFNREAQAAAALSHPNIIHVYDVSEFQGRPYIAMELVEGASLRDMIRQGGLSLADVLSIVIQICDGLTGAHEAGVVHRDVKPANILVDKKNRARLVDFGLATVTEASKLTRTGSTLGTVGYMSPEQLQGGKADVRADVFSLGVVLYEALTGRHPFRRDTEAATIEAVLHTVPEPLARYKSALPDGIQRIVDKALSKDPSTRYQHADEMLADLRAERDALSTPSRSAVIVDRVSVVSTRAFWLAATVILAVVVVLIGYWALREEPTLRTVSRQKQITFVGDVRRFDLSSDGDYLAYVRGGTVDHVVYVQDISGGEPIEVFRAHHVDDLEWSPDGTSLLIMAAPDEAFEKSGAYLVPRLGGPPRKYFGKVSSLTKVAWSPDGSRFAFTAWPGQRVYLVDVDDGDTSSFAVDADHEQMWFIDWSKDADLIILGLMTDETAALWAARPDGTGARQLNSAGPTYNACWGTRKGDLYYSRSVEGLFELRKLSLDLNEFTAKGSQETLLQFGRSSGEFSTSSDGRAFVFSQQAEWSNLWLLEPDEKTGEIRSRQLTHGASQVLTPVFSPQGNRIAYADRQGGVSDIWTITADGEDRQRLTFDGCSESPAWSPDGRRIAFLSWKSGGLKIALMDSDGSNLRVIDATTPAQGFVRIEWTPGGSILYHLREGGNIGILDTTSGVTTPLAGDGQAGLLVNPRVSPNGDRVAFWRTLFKEGANHPDYEYVGIWLMKYPDGLPQRILDRHSTAWKAPLGWSRDGDWIYLRDAYQHDNPVIYRLSASGMIDTVWVLPLSGLRSPNSVSMSPDCRQLVAAVTEGTSDLWMVEDFDPDVN